MFTTELEGLDEEEERLRMTLQYSNRQITKAGNLLRTYQGQPDSIDTTQLEWAHQVATAFRDAHQLPMEKASQLLAKAVQQVGVKSELSRRLKRYPTIIDKLGRMSEGKCGRSLELPQMQDIGGCRAVFESMGDLRCVQEELCRPLSDYQVKRVVDYIERPKPSGYRSVHVIISIDGRSIEIQLRTQVQHQWAWAVEELGQRHGFDLKVGRAPVVADKYFAMMSKVMQLEEQGRQVDAALLAELGTLRTELERHLRGGLE